MRRFAQHDWMSSSAPAYAILVAIVVLLVGVVAEHVWVAINLSNAPQQACQDLVPNAERLACFDRASHHASLPTTGAASAH